jgi:hypothetical protein
MAWLAPASKLAGRTHCLRGHEYVESNVYRLDDGYRRCLQCRREYMRRYMREYTGSAA